MQQARPGYPRWALARVQIEPAPAAELLRRALAEVIGRHEILRTSFRIVAELRSASQVVGESTEPVWLERDLTALAGEPLERALAALAEELCAGPAEAEEPALRAAWAQVAPGRAILWLALPVLAADHQTLRLLIAELAGALSGGGLPGAGEPLQYADLAEWQNDLLESEETAAGRRFWQAESRPEPPAGLPCERQPAGNEGFRLERVTVALDAATLDRLRALAAGAGAELAEAVFACWVALLARRAERSQLTLGWVSNGRKYRELRTALGPFERTLPIVSQPGEATSFAALLAQVRASLAEAKKHEEYLDLDRVLAPEAEPGTAWLPLAFAWHERLEPVSGGVGTWHLERLEALADVFALRLVAAPVGVPSGTAEALSGELEYDATRFERRDVEMLAEQFEVLATAIAAAPAAPPARHPLWGERQRQLLAQLNATRVERAQELLLHRLIGERAALASEAIAIDAGGEQLSYGELARRAEQLAQTLRLAGAGPEQWVAILAERTPAVVAAALGTLAAGAGYLPLDPSQPAQRLRRMAEGAGALLVVGAPKLLGRVGFEGSGRALGAGLELVSLAAGAARPAISISAAPRGEHPAYAIFTSGSTGEPKAVVVSHGAVCNRLLWSQEVYPLDGRDGVLQTAATGFDFSIWELFAPLLAGARLILPPSGPLDVAQIAHATRERRATVMHFVPSLLRLFLEQGAAGSAVWPGLRLVLSGGEALAAELVELFYACSTAGVPELLNQYGPTEATIDVTFWRCERASRRRLVPIGRPIANCQAFVLGARLEPVPVGVAGELHVAGAGLARGYLGRPATTAASFIPHSWPVLPGERLYKTGDLARLGSDGELDYLGRVDRQLKVRGVRVEPGEIEAALAAHPAVREAALVARGGEPRLLAYVVPAGGVSPAPGELLEFLRARLPVIMLPEAVVVIAALPRTASGKLDRAALPEPPETRASAGTGTPPRNATEATLVAIWTDLLHRGQLGVDEDFFELGGHSLIAMRLLARIRNVFEVEISLAAIFESPTIAGLAAEIDRASAGAVPPPLRRAPRERPLPVSPAQQQLWYLQQLDRASSVYNISYALEIEGELDTAALAAALGAIVRRHEVLRTVFFEREGKVLQSAPAPAPAALPCIDLGLLDTEHRARALRRWVLTGQTEPFDLGSGRLLRCRLLRLTPTLHALQLVTHHIVCDAWSLGIFSRELAVLYTAASTGRPSPLAELAVQYADFALWQRNWLESGDFEPHLEHWRRHLEGAPTALELPEAAPRPALLSRRGGQEVLRLGGALSAGLRQLGRREGASPFMVLLALWTLLLRLETGQRDLVVGTTSASRDRPEIQPLIGFFINLLPLRTRIDDAMSFRELLAGVRQTVLGAFRHQDVPFDRLLEALRLPRERNRPPLVQVLINVFQSAEIHAPELPGLCVRPLGIGVDAARFDLVLDVTDGGDELVAALRYSADLFRPAEMQALLRRFESLGELVLERPEAPIESLLSGFETAREQQLEARRRGFAETRRALLQRKKTSSETQG